MTLDVLCLTFLIFVEHPKLGQLLGKRQDVVHSTLTLHRLMAQLTLSKKEGRYLNKIRALAKMDVLILDDFGLHPIQPEYRQILMDITDDRFNIKSTIICSQLPVKAWHELIGEPTVADAILDRIIHNAHRIELKGESLRKRKINELKK